MPAARSLPVEKVISMYEHRGCIADVINSALNDSAVQTIKIIKLEETASLKIEVEVNNYTTELEVTDNLVEALKIPGTISLSFLVIDLEEKEFEDASAE